MSPADTWNSLPNDPFQSHDLNPDFREERSRAFRHLDLRSGERLLIVGAGSGADLEHVPGGLEVDAVDGSATMLERARRRRRPGMRFRRMDAEKLAWRDGQFDAVVLHQVLGVVRDPARCLAEALRVLRPGGRLSIFDRFLPPGFRPPLWHRVASSAIDVVFTAPNRSFEEMIAPFGDRIRVVVDEDRGPLLPFRILLLRTESGSSQERIESHGATFATPILSGSQAPASL